METAVLKVNGMTCMGCVAGVKKVLMAIDGVQSVDVSLEKAQATIGYDAARVRPAQFKTAIDDAGYESAA
jgi:copper chaperone